MSVGGGRGPARVERTGKVAPTPDTEAPPRVLGQCVQHVVQEADAGPHPDGLRRAHLGGVVRFVLAGHAWVGGAVAVWKDVEGAAVKAERDLNGGLFRVALYERRTPLRRLMRTHLVRCE